MSTMHKKFQGDFSIEELPTEEELQEIGRMHLIPEQMGCLALELMGDKN